LRVVFLDRFLQFCRFRAQNHLHILPFKINAVGMIASATWHRTHVPRHHRFVALQPTRHHLQVGVTITIWKRTIHQPSERHCLREGKQVGCQSGPRRMAFPDCCLSPSKIRPWVRQERRCQSNGGSQLSRNDSLHVSRKSSDANWRGKFKKNPRMREECSSGSKQDCATAFKSVLQN